MSVGNRVSPLEELAPIYDSSDSDGDSSVPMPRIAISVVDGSAPVQPIVPAAAAAAANRSWLRRAAGWVANTVTTVTDAVFAGTGSSTGLGVLSPRRRAAAGGASNEPIDDVHLYVADKVYTNPYATLSRQQPGAAAGLLYGSSFDSRRRALEHDPRAEDSPAHSSDGRGSDDGTRSNSGAVDDDADDDDIPDGYGEMTVRVDLVTAIRCYRRSPDDALFSLVSTALASRSISNPVTGVELLEARGDPSLVGLIIENGCLDITDPVVKQELARLVTARLVPSPMHAGRVNPSSSTLLRKLLSVSCVRIDEWQRDLLRVSGFEFVQLLHDYPHLLADIPAPVCLSIEFWSRVSRKLDALLLLVGIAIIYFDIVAVSMVVINFFNQGYDVSGWVTLLAWVGGDYMNMLATKVLTATKADASVYGEWMADFPTPFLKIVPCLPLFETFTFASALKHKCFGRANYVVQHDLVAMFTLTCINHSLFTATIQIMLQSYLHSWIGDDTLKEYIGYQLLVISTLISLCTALPLYLRFVVTFDSVNSVGFAFFGDQMATDNKPPVSKFARVLAFVLLYFLEFNVFLLVIAIVHVSSCSTLMIVWIAVSGVIILFTTVMFTLSMVTTRSLFRASRWLFLPVCIQVAFTLFFNLYDSDEISNGDCRLFLLIGGMTIIYGYVGWGMLVAIFAAWGIYKLYVSYRRERAGPEVDSAPTADAASTVTVTVIG